MREETVKIFAHGYLNESNIINQITPELWAMFFKDKYSHQKFTGGEIETREFKVTIKVELNEMNPKPFIRPCHFCGVEVRMQKDQSEGQPVACFEHSYKFMENLKR